MKEYELISEFKDRPFFTKRELFEFLDKRKNELSDSYYRLLLSNLRKRGIIKIWKGTSILLKANQNFFQQLIKE